VADAVENPPPPWLRELAARASTLTATELGRIELPADDEVAGESTRRHSAVLILFGDGSTGPDVLLIERSDALRHHAGQVAFPGGAIDPTDDGPVAAALREAVEETGLDPAGVDVVASLTTLWLPPSGFFVTPVIAWWRAPSAVAAVDAAEVAAVVRMPIADLVDPANRVRVRHSSGHVGPAFEAGDLLIWGFTAYLLDRLIEVGGFAQPWDPGRIRDLDR
jgi:8-oxo-dGTP pyrophosphatase MutT (NUDIX family)